jgi:hypothetical protein
MSKIFNHESFQINSQFSGGEAVTPLTGSAFFESTKLYGGLYVGGFGDITVRTVDSSVITLKNVSGFVPGLITAVSASSTATDIVGLL